MHFCIILSLVKTIKVNFKNYKLFFLTPLAFVIVLPLSLNFCSDETGYFVPIVITDFQYHDHSASDESTGWIRLPSSSSEIESMKLPYRAYTTVVDSENAQMVVVVEDHYDMRAYVSEQLSAIYQVVEAEDGKDGFEKLKTDKYTIHILIILLTARSFDERKIEGLKLEADVYLIKAFDSCKLRFRVNNLIEQRHKIRERFNKEIKLQPKDIAITSADEQFLQRALDIIDQHFSDENFSVKQFGWKIGLSRSQLHRKLNTLTDQSMIEFIRTNRLKKAVQLLEQKYGTVAEITYRVSFGDPSNFTRCFCQQFGVSSSDYAVI